MTTPIELEQIRQDELAGYEKQSAQSSQKTVDSTLIQDATPENLKLQGTAKLPLLIFTLGSQIPQIIQPSLQGLIQTYIPDPNVCPTESTLSELISQRNNIVVSLNNIGNRINQLGVSITGESNFLNITLRIITVVDIANIIASEAAKFVPLIPGIIPAALNDAQTLIRKLTFDKEGNSKLSKTQGILSSSALVISIVGTYILNAKSSLEIIDLYINKCQLNPNIVPTSSTINSISDAQRQAQQTNNQVTYNGFIIEIEEVPFTPTVNRRRALGKNQQGIILIQTELSFTLNSQTLINELKLIIDRDNLYADFPPVTPTPIITNPFSNLIATQSISTSAEPGNPDPIGFLGTTIGEKAGVFWGNGQIEDIYEWDGKQWNYIETTNIN
jgi:hypothetical protein